MPGSDPRRASVGILRMDNRIPRIPGDIGNETTFEFPVSYERIAGSTNQRVVYEQGRGLLEPYIAGARKLEADGVDSITTTCGFLAMFQPELATSVGVPLFASSLILVPLVHRMTGRRVGILTGDENALGPTHFSAAGWSPEEMPVAIRGLQDQAGFRALIEDKPEIDAELIGREMVAAATDLVRKHPDIGAFVLECTNMAPYAHLVQAATERPVFDVQTLANFVHEATHRVPYEQRP